MKARPENFRTHCLKTKMLGLLLAWCGCRGWAGPKRKRAPRHGRDVRQRVGQKISWFRYYEFRKQYTDEFFARPRLGCVPFPKAVERCVKTFPDWKTMHLYAWRSVSQLDLETALRILADEDMSSRRSCGPDEKTVWLSASWDWQEQAMPISLTSASSSSAPTRRRNTRTRIVVEDADKNTRLLQLVGRFFSRVTWHGALQGLGSKVARDARNARKFVDEVYIDLGSDCDIGDLDLFPVLTGVSLSLLRLVLADTWNQIVRRPSITRVRFVVEEYGWSWHRDFRTESTLPNLAVRECALELPPGWKYFRDHEQMRRLTGLLKFLREYAPRMETFWIRPGEHLPQSVVDDLVATFRELAFSRLVLLNFGSSHAQRLSDALDKFDPMFRWRFRVRRRISLLAWRRCAVAHSRRFQK